MNLVDELLGDNAAHLLASTRRWYVFWCVIVFLLVLGRETVMPTSFMAARGRSQHWIGTWAAAPQNEMSSPPTIYRNQTLRLIVHISAGGKRVRIRLANMFGAETILIGSAHIACRTVAADVDPSSDRPLTFAGKQSIRVAPHSVVISDGVDIDVPALSDVAVSLFFPESTTASTGHILAQQTNYVSEGTGDATASANFPVAKKITSWPFLTGVDVGASDRGAAVVAFGSSLTDGDGSTRDANCRWPDVLAERLQKNGATEIGVLNEGVIGNRLLSDTESPLQTGGPLAAAYAQLGPHLGQSGVRRFENDVLDQSGVKYVVLALGVNDILFPGSFIDSSQAVTAQALISGNRELIARAHKKGIRAIGTTIPPFEHALFRSPSFDQFYTPEKEKVREEVNEWVRRGGAFDGFIDFDEVVRDPNHPTQILPAYDSGDHLHVNDAGNLAQGDAIRLSLFHAKPMLVGKSH
jgi:lysophospholipase L1-like esterase